MTQKELSLATQGQVSLAHIGLIETGERNASIDTLNALAAALSLTGDEYTEFLKAAGHPLDNEAMIVKFRGEHPDYEREVFVNQRAMPTGDEEEALAALAGVDRLTPERRARLLGYLRALIDEQTSTEEKRPVSPDS